MAICPEPDNLDRHTPAHAEADVASTKMQLHEVCGGLAPSRTISSDQPLQDAIDLFNADPELVGLLVVSPGEPSRTLFRTRMFHEISQSFHKDLYSGRPIRRFLNVHLPTPPLTLPHYYPLQDAIEAVMSRDAVTRYDPILVTHGAGEPQVVDARVLLEHQRRMLTRTIAEVDRQRKKAEYASMHDRLTGLPNRAKALKHLRDLARRFRETDEHYSLLFIDFDRFKLINDSLGHEAGDELLIQISQRIQDLLGSMFGQGDWLASRLGGDEFLILYWGPGHANARDEQIAEQLIKAMSPPFRLAGYDMHSSPSIGVTRSSISDGGDPAAVLRDADLAMYRAKAEGRNRHIVFDRSMHEDSLRRLDLESKLRQAIEDDELVPYFQPITRCESGRIIGFEALVRWNHPELGQVSPTAFIPIAEDTGLIIGLGRSMLVQSLQQLAAWQDELGLQDRLYMSVNVSKRQLLQPDFVRQLEQIIRDTGLKPSDVNLEITESVVIGQTEAVVRVLKAIKQLGCKISMDDFGTGMSSLTSLHQYPLDVLKIDQAFVRNLEHNPVFSALVQAITTLAKNLGMSVTVEGVERVEQLVQIQTLDCEAAQGYLFAKPMPADEATRYLCRQLGVLRHSAKAEAA